MNIYARKQWFPMIGSARGTGKIRLDLGTKKDYNFDILSPSMIRPSHEVYKYHQKSIDSFRPQASVGGISVKLVNPTREIGNIFIFSYFKLRMRVLYYGTRVCMCFLKGKVMYGIKNIISNK